MEESHCAINAVPTGTDKQLDLNRSDNVGPTDPSVKS